MTALHKEDFKEDVVYLYEIPACRTIVSVSPYALKVRTWLRWRKIPFECICGISRWSKYGQIPFIELNGEQIADSNIILQKLSKKYNKEDQHLTSEQRAIARAFSMMIENQTVFSYFYYRYIEDTDKFLSTWEFFTEEMRKNAIQSFPVTYKDKMAKHGIGRHEVSDVYDFGCQDLQAISDYLGDKKYIFGDEMSTLDCYVFGHVCQILFIPIDYPHKAYVHQHCPNLVSYINRMKEEFWPDWDSYCENHMFDN